ncbi:hypothetical protein HYPSUDRAFT_139010, partial [Hypholoma sublateritium FD-334 SS-4]
RSTDVLQDMRVTVCAEGSDKERFLGDDEIVENIVHNATSSVEWSIHRPIRGWYIRIRSPTFPPGVFIPLTPVSAGSVLHTEAAMSFNTRTNIPTPPGLLAESSSQFTLQDRESTSSTASVHSYPPTPTATTQINIRPPSPIDITDASFERTPQKARPRRPAQGSPSQITQFLLSAHSSQPVEQPVNASLFARALSLVKSQRPSHSNSFTLSRVLAAQSPPPPPYASNISPPAHVHMPLLVFHDRTPVLTVRSLTGLLEIDKAEERLMGVSTSFWIAIALTYLEFLEERESYLAALSD